MKKKLLFGLLGGALGGIAMKAVVAAVDRNAFGLSAATDAKAAREVCRRFGLRLRDQREAEMLGAAMHYSFAVFAGVAYAAGAESFPFLRAAKGAAFGTALWLIGDELAVSIAGLEQPLQVPLNSHLSALGAHVIFGMILETLLANAEPRAEHGR